MKINELNLIKKNLNWKKKKIYSVTDITGPPVIVLFASTIH
jgi:hypothetical protein